MLKQDKVNNANSVFILINLLISWGCHSGSIGQAQGVGRQGPRWSRGRPPGSQGAKGLACRVPRGQGVGRQGPKWSRGRSTGSQGVKG